MSDLSPDEIVERERRLRDREAQTYDRGRSPWEVSVHRHAALHLLDLHPGETVLDAGAGTGINVQAFLATGASVVAVDHSEKMLEVARDRLPEAERDRVRTVAADLRSLPLEDTSVDAAACLGVLQHFPTHELRLDALRELHRCLRPGGRLVVISYRWLGHVKRHRDGWWSPDLYRYAFTVREIGAMMRETGFADVRAGGLVVLPHVSERLGVRPQTQLRLAFTPVGRWLGEYVVARGVRPL